MELYLRIPYDPNIGNLPPFRAAGFLSFSLMRFFEITGG